MCVCETELPPVRSPLVHGFTPLSRKDLSCPRGKKVPWGVRGWVVHKHTSSLVHFCLCLNSTYLPVSPRECSINPNFSFSWPCLRLNENKVRGETFLELEVWNGLVSTLFPREGESSYGFVGSTIDFVVLFYNLMYLIFEHNSIGQFPAI